MNQIVEDVLGAALWVRKNISAYKGDPSKLVVTGDSAGGHLAEMVVLCGNKLESDGFAGNSLGYKPTYLPPGMTAEQIALENGLDVQAAILSYAAFDMYSSCLTGFETSSNIFWIMAGATPRGIFGDSINVQDNPDFYQTVSPIYNIPLSTERVLPPQLCIVGSNDNLITPASVQNYVALLQQNGHSAEYWEHAGRPHAFLDSGKNDFLGTKFSKDAPPALDRMIQFLDQVFNQ
jgi:acetyl esterase